MKKSVAVVLTFLMVACSTNPEAQKQKYLISGTEYFQKAKYQEAAIQFRNAIQVDPRSAEAHYKLAQALAAQRNSEGAYRELTETVSLDPRNANAQLQLASLLLTRRQYDQAQVKADEVLATDPNNAR